jgi:hypothetical protein
MVLSIIAKKKKKKFESQRLGTWSVVDGWPSMGKVSVQSSALKNKKDWGLLSTSM